MSEPERQVREALEALRVGSDGSFSWFGRRFAPPPGRTLAPALAGRLYANFYCTGGATPHFGPEEPPSSVGDPGFTVGLAAANASPGAWKEGWRVAGVDGDDLVVECRGLRLRASPGEVRREPAGDAAAVWWGRERLGLTPGFFLALAEDPAARSRHLVRFYLNVTSAGAAAAVRGLTERLVAADLPFRLKVVDDPRGYGRCDSAVLYVARDDRDAVQARVIETARELDGALRRSVPALTLALGAGVAFAEDPGGSESFGESRCRLIAEAVLRAAERGQTTPSGRLAAVAERFHEDGLDLSRPHLCAPPPRAP